MIGDPYTRAVSALLFPMHERLKGHPTVSLLHSLERTQWWSAERLQDLQLDRLRQLLAFVSRQVPYYRNLFQERALGSEQFRVFTDLQHLPVVDKPLIRARGERWRAENAARLITQRTSGSSGEPLTFLLGRQRIGMDIANKWRATRWWGVDFGDRELVLWGSAIESSRQNRLRVLRDRLFRSRLVSAHDLGDDRMDRILEQMRVFRPRMLFGYPSALARLAWRVRTRGLTLNDLGIRVAFTTSEVLRPEWRAVIGEVFGCGVANEYGARDAGFIARECPEGGLHISAEALIVEILDRDGRPVPCGETGDIVVTNLVGPEFPFIRYRTGDRGALDPEPCTCGRGLPLLRSLEGRTNDGLLALDGSWVHGSSFNYLLRELNGLKAYKIIQESREQVEVLLSLDGSLPAGFEARLRTAFQRRLGESVRVSLHRLDDIPPEPNGKYRHVVCRVDGAANHVS